MPYPVASKVCRSVCRAVPGNAQGGKWFLSEDFKLSGISPTMFYDALNQRLAVNSSEVILSNFQTVTRSHIGSRSATYHDSLGRIQIATANTPRFDYDPSTLQPKGILVEPASGNTVRYSEDLSQAAWTKTGCTASLDASAINPYGTTGMYKITEDGATSEHGVNIASNSGGTSPSWASVFVKNSSGSRNVIVSMWNSTSGHFYSATFNPVTGAFVSGSGHTDYKAIQYPNGIWRFMVKGAAPSVKADFVYVRMASGTTASYAGDSTSSIYVWGAMRDGESPTSYIPNNTGVSTVTREADVISNSASNTLPFSTWYSAPSEGTLLVAYSVLNEGNTVNKMAVSIDDNTANEAIRVGFFDNASDSLSFEIVDGGVSQFDSDIFAYSPGVNQYQALGFKTNDTYSAANETSGALDTAVTLPTPTLMRIGSSSTGEYLTGHVRYIVFWPVRVSNLTTLSLASETFYNG